ncbi:MAG TPA: four helix bundle protein [Chitinophagaceae bacterium]|nr:four helix bundle protein [Chitinophagaceae bacterium]
MDYLDEPDIFQATKALTRECYKAILLLPAEEKFALIQQIRRAALSGHLNVAEGCSVKSGGERKSYFEIAGGAVVEIDTAFGIAVNLKYCTEENLQVPGKKIISAYKQLSGLIG